MIIVHLLLIFNLWLPSLAVGESFPPFYIKKVPLGCKMTPFTLEAISGEIFCNRSFISQPYLFITGSYRLRHDVRKWANHINMHYALYTEIAWIFNPARSKFTDKKNKTINAMNRIRMPLPVIIDSHSIIGRSLKIDYQIPSIIGISTDNRLMFVLESPANKAGKKKLHNLIKSRLLK